MDVDPPPNWSKNQVELMAWEVEKIHLRKKKGDKFIEYAPREWQAGEQRKAFCHEAVCGGSF